MRCAVPLYACWSNMALDTLSLAAYLGRANVQNTKRYARVNAERFAGLWPD